jgi:2-polyprenyl-3-methyl-5-hydroxy-6-metoxy-1,4-benzoquinol methylase
MAADVENPHTEGPMELRDLTARRLPPIPWEEGDNIPWHDPQFSARMLREHLSQDHDAASRRAATIDRHVNWLHEAVLLRHPTTVLDLGCGPGLYTSSLARLGHECVGIDYSPAAIDHARATATEENLACRYLHADLRQGQYGAGFGLALLIYGELNVFTREHATQILRRMHDALKPDGVLVLEPHTFAAIRRNGERPATWYTAQQGLFSNTPYLLLQEHFWHAARRITMIRYYAIELKDGSVTRYTQSLQAYTEEEYRALLRECGFTDITFFAALTGETTLDQGDFCAIVARK